MSTIIPAFGNAQQYSNLTVLLSDMLNGMGDYLTQDIGSLNWCESYINARALVEDIRFIQLMANQLSPASASILLDQWAQIYNVAGNNSPGYIENYIEFKQSLFNTPPTLTNLDLFFSNTLGQIFIDIEVRPELQTFFATTDPVVQIGRDGYAYGSPLSVNLVYVWQPRDNQDNLLMNTNIFNGLVDSYHAIIEGWNPAYLEFQTMLLSNRGFDDGYGNDYNGNNFNNYLDGYNVVSATSGTATITGTGTAFLFYPNGQIGDFVGAVNEGFYPPIQIIDDSGVLQTYFVASVQSNTHLTLTTNIINTITNRTYRTLGIILDTAGALDGGMLFGV